MGTFQQPQANRNYARTNVSIMSDGTMHVHLSVTNDGGKLVDRITVIVPPSGAIIDDQGNEIAAAVPGALDTARNSFLTAVDAAIDNAAANDRFVK